MARISSRVPRRRHAVRRLSSCLALAAAAGMSGYASGASYTWTGTGSDAYWNDANDWTPTSGYPGTTSSDTAVFSGAMTQTPTLNGSSYSIGELVFSTTNNWTLDGIGATLTLNTGGANAGVGINALSQASGTTVTINPYLALPTNQTFEVASGATLVLAGAVYSATNASAPNLTITGGGTINYVAALPSSGSALGNITVNSGSTLTVSGSGSLDTGTTSVLNLNGGTAIADNRGAGQATPNRYGLAASFNSGTFILYGNESAPVQENLGATTIGTGFNMISVISTGAEPLLSISSLTRAAGAGILFVNGEGLGTNDNNTVNGQIGITSGVSGAVGTTQAGTSDQSVKNLQILPYVIGEAPDQAGAVGSHTGIPDTFVAYTNGSTLRPLNPFDEYSHMLDSSVNGNNIYIDSPTTATTASINSLVINNADLTIGDGQAVTLAGGALLFVTNNSIKSTGSGTFAFGNGTEDVVSVDRGVTGTIAAPLTGSNPITVPGPGLLNLTSGSSTYSGTFTVPTAGTLQFGPGSAVPLAATLNFTGGTIIFANGTNPGYTTPINVDNGILQFGSGTAGNDASLTNAGSTITMTNSGNGAVAINNFGATTFNAAINTPSTGVNGNLYVVGPGAVTFNGPMDLESGPGAPFLWLHGGAGGGPITFNGPLTMNPAIVQGSGSSYFYVATNGGVTFNDTSASSGTTIYMEGIPTSVIYGGITTPTIGGTIPNIVVTLSSSGSIGNGFANGNPNTPNANSPAITLTISNINRAGTNVLPPPTTFNQNGPINATGGIGNYVTTDGYYSGATIWNVNAPLAVAGSFRLTAGVYLNGANQPTYGILNVAPGQVVTNAPSPTVNTSGQTGYFIVGYGQTHTFNGVNVLDDSYGHLYVGAGATINADANRGTTYFAYNAHGLVDLTNLNADGSTGAGSTFNTYYQVTMNGGGTYAGQASAVNIYPGSALNMYSVKSTPNITNNTGAAEYPAGTAAAGAGNFLSMDTSNGGALGDTAILNVMGGTVNNANSVAGTGANYGPAINMYGTTGNDNHATTAMPTSVLNISNGGVVRTGYVRAETISFNSINSDAATFINFGGFNNAGTYLPGELDYNQANASQGSFIQYGVAGTYIYAGGAKIGTSIDNTNFTTNSATITQGLMAAPGRGVASISLPNGPIGSGYASAPIVLVKDAQGFDATAYAVVDTTPTDANYGKITSIVVSNPGFNFDGSAALTFVGGGGTAPTSGYAINLTPTTSSGFQASGGLTKLDAGTLTLIGTYNGTNSTSTSLNSITGTGTAAAVGLGNIPAANAGNAPAGFRNNTSTYAGPTVIEAGTLALSNNSTNNNIPYSSMIVVGDVPANGGAIFDTSGVGTAGGFQLGPNQILAGFGTVRGTGGTGANAGVTIGAAASGNNFGGGSGTNGLPAIAANGAGSMIAPGISPAIGTAQGTAAGSNTPVTGALKLTSSGASPMATTFAPGGSYYWKLNLGTGGGGATSSPGTYSASGANVSGAAWDALVLDSLAVPSGSSPFTIQAVSFGTALAGGVNIGGSNNTSYTWVVAHANDASITNGLLANLALNASAMPSPASGYSYSLSTFSDPSGGSDLAVVYSPAPEPTTLMLLGPAAAAMLLRRRRRNAGQPEQAA